MFASKDALIANAGGGYPINNSLRFRSSASAYLNRTPASAGSRTTWTFSAWIKRGSLGGTYRILQAATSATPTTDDQYFGFLFNSSDQLACGFVTTTPFVTTQVFRDSSAWYHIVLALDTTNATTANRIKVYVNGTQITSFASSATITLNQNTALNTTSSQTAIGREILSGTSGPFDGYMAEVNFIDGQALTPSSFGAYDATTGVWQPARYTGTYGTNGFYLKFASFGTAAALGTDSSGNGNTWTVNNISVTAGVTYDPMLDSPTLTSATVANYPVFNAISANGYTITAANLNVSNGGVGRGTVSSTFTATTGKYYWEGTGVGYVGAICGPTTINYTGTISATGSKSIGYWSNGIVYWDGGNSGAGPASYSTTDIIGVALDMTAGTIAFYKNNSLQYTATFGSGTVPTFTTGAIPCYNDGTNASYTAQINFGQRPFSYTPPTGYVALNAYNLPTPTIANGATVMAATLYTGNGTSQAVSNAVNGQSFQPDLVWYKSRSAALDNYLIDDVRGAGDILVSNSTAAEIVLGPQMTFDPGGFSVGGLNAMNQNAATFVGWNWKAGNSSGSSNTNGTITSTVSVNATAGFSVVTYTGTGGVATVGHGLGVAPSMIVLKSRSAVQNWYVYHISVGNTGALNLNLTGATVTSSNLWNNTSPTSSVFTVNDNGAGWTNPNTQPMVAYCWSAVAGYSAFGSYTGNGSADGPFIYCGFRPRFFMVKRTDSTGGWNMTDTSMAPYNLAQPLLQANTSAAEIQAFEADILSNGLKYRGASTNTLYDHNVSGATYIYAAFAENPFKYALAR